MATKLKYDKAKRTIVTVTDNLEMCASCIQPVAKDWTYCPYCGAQERNSETGEHIRRQR
jgi:hypothetical protein